uniref:Uncharacterized protein n=1 Tax=Rhizophora mucronata TaxID=61149 RepID=A0A2P2MZU5_RHIMU
MRCQSSSLSSLVCFREWWSQTISSINFRPRKSQSSMA